MLALHTLTETEYKDLRYRLLVNVEESGDAKEAPYLDSENLPTIGEQGVRVIETYEHHLVAR